MRRKKVGKSRVRGVIQGVNYRRSAGSRNPAEIATAAKTHPNLPDVVVAAAAATPNTPYDPITLNPLYNIILYSYSK
jgi:hypothetical protein